MIKLVHNEVLFIYPEQMLKTHFLEKDNLPVLTYARY